MRRLSLCLLLALPPGGAAAQVTAITHVTVIDGADSAPRRDQTVVVRGNRISAVGRASGTAVPSGARVVDGRDKYLVPGFWDMHVHTVAPGGREVLALYVANGVLGVRDMAGDWAQVTEWRREIAAGRLVGPRIVAAGPYIEGGDVPIAHLVARTPEEARAAVDSLARLGVDFVKLHSQFKREVYFAAERASRERGMAVAGHVPRSVTAREASDSGLKSLEHMLQIPTPCTPAESLALAPRFPIQGVLGRCTSEDLAPLFARFVSNGTWVVPTLVAQYEVAAWPHRELPGDSFAAYLPDTLRRYVAQIFPMPDSVPPDADLVGRALWEKRIALVGVMRRAGVGVLPGTDAPLRNSPPGFGLHQELALFARAGLSPFEVLRAATYEPARYLGALDSLGTIAAGKVADLVLLDADPLADVGNLRRINAVVANGRLFDARALASRSLPAQERAIPFWPDAVRTAIHAHVDGVAVLETVRELARFHRVHASPGFAAAAEHMRQRLASAGLGDATIERFPADGSTKYAHFRSYYGWQPVAATLQELSPEPTLLASFPELPVALADFSQDADVTAELVDVGQGTRPADYLGREVAGKIAIASGPLPLVHRLAVEERSAAGFLSDFPNQTTAWSGDDRDLVRWGHLSAYQLKNRFAFMLSKRQSGRLRERLARGERIVVRAQVKARMAPGTFDVVTATIPGTDRAAEEIVLTAHLDHQSAGANDNASGSAAILEVALALHRAISDGSLPPPRRTIRFLWTPEIAGTLAYLVSRPEVTNRLRAGIHMDMVGGLLGTIRGTFHLSRSAESVPHIANQIAAAWFDDVVRTSAQYAERGGDPYEGLVWPPGSREAFLGDLRAIEMGSDHQVLEDGAFRIPMVYFHDWPDVTIHTNKDQPENLDATKLGRVAFLGAGIAWTLAALPDSEAGRLVVLARAGAEEQAARARARAALGADPRDGLLFEREALAQGIETLRSVASLWPVTATAVTREVDRLQRLEPVVPAGAERDARVPMRSAEVRGPLEVYHYDHLSEVLGPDADVSTALSRRANGEVLCYETLNLVDGRRSVSDIRDILTGRYQPVLLKDVAEYLALLERARVIRF